MKKNVFYIFRNDKEIGKNKFIYKAAIVRESLLYSIISDLFTFGTILFSFWVNSQFIHSKALSLFLLISFIISMSSYAKRQIVTLSEFKEEINNFISEIEEN